MNDRLQKQLKFALEIDKEKNIFRQTHLSGHGRNENRAGDSLPGAFGMSDGRRFWLSAL